MLDGETISTGASHWCEDCGMDLELSICHSFAGYYIGTECDCGPYSRESEYFRSADEARLALEGGNYGR